MANKFTKLNIGDSVASSGGRAWKKLSVESAEGQDELAGTWVFNEKLDFSSILDVMAGGKAFMNFSSNGVDYCEMSFAYMSYKNSGGVGYRQTSDSKYTQAYNFMNSTASWRGDYKTITITTSYSELSVNGFTSKEQFLTWLQANATKIA